MRKIEPNEISFFIEKCKEYNLRVTPQRLAIYRELVYSKKHPSADAMFHIIKKEFPNISFDTVNRTLLTFSEMGIAEVVEGCGPRRFDPNKVKHHHLYCKHCGKLIDFCSIQYDKLTIPKDIQPFGVVTMWHWDPIMQPLPKWQIPHTLVIPPVWIRLWSVVPFNHLTK